MFENSGRMPIIEMWSTCFKSDLVLLCQFHKLVDFVSAGFHNFKFLNLTSGLMQFVHLVVYI